MNKAFREMNVYVLSIKDLISRIVLYYEHMMHRLQQFSLNVEVAIYAIPLNSPIQVSFTVVLVTKDVPIKDF